MAAATSSIVMMQMQMQMMMLIRNTTDSIHLIRNSHLYFDTCQTLIFTQPTKNKQDHTHSLIHTSTLSDFPMQRTHKNGYDLLPIRVVVAIGAVCILLFVFCIRICLSVFRKRYKVLFLSTC